MSLYNKRGVSAQKEDVHKAIKNLDKGLYDSTFCKILPDYLTNSNEHCCIMHADTAGTKSILAYLYWKETNDISVWKNIAQDALVMNIDDMMCSGATNNFIISSTIARNKNLITGDVLSAIINGFEEIIKEWKQFGINLYMAGGETADVGDLVKTIDVGYTAMARLKQNEIVHIKPKVGDVIVGFASFGKATYETKYNSGIGCNGLTSARHDLLSKYYEDKYPETYDQNLDKEVTYIGKYKLTDEITEGLNIGQLLLSPTRTYVPIIKEILENYFSKINGIIHSTGGGQTKCLKYINEPLKIIKDNLLEVPEIFKLIQKSSNVDDKEMYQVFNMGQRLEVYTDETTATNIISIAQKYNIDAKIIGRFEKADNKSLVINTPENKEIIFT